MNLVLQICAAYRKKLFSGDSHVNREDALVLSTSSSSSSSLTKDKHEQQQAFLRLFATLRARGLSPLTISNEEEQHEESKSLSVYKNQTRSTAAFLKKNSSKQK